LDYKDASKATCVAIIGFEFYDIGADGTRSANYVLYNRRVYWGLRTYTTRITRYIRGAAITRAYKVIY
jgi:hypothetical protein